MHIYLNVRKCIFETNGCSKLDQSEGYFGFADLGLCILDVNLIIHCFPDEGDGWIEQM